MMRSTSLILCSSALLLSACGMSPHPALPPAPVPGQWPAGAAYPPADAAPAEHLDWQSQITDARLRKIITRMLANNRDLRASVANVLAARAQFRADRSALLPTIAGTASGSNVASPTNNTYSLGLGLSSFQVDLFGRLRETARASFETYLSTQSGMRATKLSLVQQTAQAYVTLAADRDLLAIARDTQGSAQRTVELNEALLAAGLGNAADVESARTILAQAQSDMASATTQVAQDRNALDLLAGAPVADSLLPASLADIEGGIGVVPTGLSSQILLQRPDVVEAEHTLRAGNYSIGAARAAFFPTINLTTAFGFASPALSSLFQNGSSGWTVTPSASLPLVGGARFANLAAARANEAAYVAAYEKAIQTAFRDVADALARRGTIADQRAAQARLVTAAQASLSLSTDKYRVGSGAFLDVLTAQRTLYAARQTEVSTRLADLSNRLALYAALGADPTL